MQQGNHEAAFDVSALDERTTLVTVRGELDLATGSDFQDALATALSETTGSLVIDLRDCSFIDSVSIGVLLSARRALEARQAGDRPMAVVASKLVARTLKLSGIDLVIPICSTPEKALATLESA